MGDLRQKTSCNYLMTNVRVKFQRSAYEMAYYRNEITPNRKKQSTCSGQKPIRKNNSRKSLTALMSQKLLQRFEAQYYK